MLRGGIRGGINGEIQLLAIGQIFNLIGLAVAVKALSIRIDRDCGRRRCRRHLLRCGGGIRSGKRHRQNDAAINLRR